MANSLSLRVLLLGPLRIVPADLAAIVAITVLTNVAVFAPLVRETRLRIPLGLAFLLFVPGYAFLAALFPEQGSSPVTDGPETDEGSDTVTGTGTGTDLGGDPTDSTARNGIDGLERAILASVLSVAIIPLIGLVLNVTPWGIRLVPFAVFLTGFVLGATAVAVVRRWQLPAGERFRVPYREWLGAGQSMLLEPPTRLDAVLNVVLVVSLVVAASTVGVAVLAPSLAPDVVSTQGEQFSAVYILTEDESGERIADDYPSELAVGESDELIVGVDNEELRPVEYTLVVAEQRIDRHGPTNVTVTDQRELERFEPQLAHNETWTQRHDIEPTTAGEVRIVWLLYPEDVPDEPTMENAAYHVHLWLDVTESNE